MVFHQSYATLSIYIGQSSCHCVFIYSYFHRQLLTSLHDDLLHCFCFLVESYETIKSIHGPVISMMQIFHCPFPLGQIDMRLPQVPSTADPVLCLLLGMGRQIRK